MVQAAWEGLRKERGGDVLNRFLATWEKLHSGPEATPTAHEATPTSHPKKKKWKNREEKEGERQREGERERGEDSDEENDIVKDFIFSEYSD